MIPSVDEALGMVEHARTAPNVAQDDDGNALASSSSALETEAAEEVEEGDEGDEGAEDRVEEHGRRVQRGTGGRRRGSFKSAPSFILIQPHHVSTAPSQWEPLIIPVCRQVGRETAWHSDQVDQRLHRSSQEGWQALRGQSYPHHSLHSHFIRRASR
jgi:hypothetical protein